jgi:hypothetical protein
MYFRANYGGQWTDVRKAKYRLIYEYRSIYYVYVKTNEQKESSEIHATGGTKSWH